jgi:hypothetical protein
MGEGIKIFGMLNELEKEGLGVCVDDDASMPTSLGSSRDPPGTGLAGGSFPSSTPLPSEGSSAA